MSRDFSPDLDSSREVTIHTWKRCKSLDCFSTDFTWVIRPSFVNLFENTLGLVDCFDYGKRVFPKVSLRDR